MRLRGQDGLDIQSLNAFSILRDTRQRFPAILVNKMGFYNGPACVNPFRAISLYIFLFSLSLQFSGSVDAAFSRPGLHLYPAWYAAAVNDGRKATGAAGAQRR
jgi:hypothetical protein